MGRGDHCVDAVGGVRDVVGVYAQVGAVGQHAVHGQPAVWNLPLAGTKTAKCRPGAAAVLRQAWAVAAAPAARLLRQEVEALGRRGRIALTPEPAAGTPEDAAAQAASAPSQDSTLTK